MYKNLKHHWSIQELVTIGVFAAAAKVITMVVALAGGGMNPVTLLIKNLIFLIKNLIFTTFFIVMLYKVRKSGTIMLFTFVSLIVSLLLMGAEASTSLGMFMASFIGEFFILLFGGMKNKYAPIIGVAAFDLSYRVLSMFIAYIVMRETPENVYAVIPIIAIGYLGAVIGLYTGIKAVKELRYAGIVRS